MTREVFLEQCSTLACRACGAVGLTSEIVINNGGFRAVCPTCDARGVRCIGIEFIPRGNRDRRRPLKAGELREIWKVNGDHCTFCGKSWDACEALKIGRTQQHVHPLAFGGDEGGTVVPFCARCQEASSAALRETRDLVREFVTLKEIWARFEAKHPEFRAELQSDLGPSSAGG